MANITFDTLNESAKIFDELMNQKPIWWEYCKQDKSFYIELRKDNQVNVYFEGGSIIRVHYCSRHKELQTFTHYKYLGLKDKSKIREVVRARMLIAFIIAFIFFILGLFSLHFLINVSLGFDKNLDSKIVENAVNYMRIITFS